MALVQTMCRVAPSPTHVARALYVALVVLVSRLVNFVPHHLPAEEVKRYVLMAVVRISLQVTLLAVQASAALIAAHLDFPLAAWMVRVRMGRRAAHWV